MSTEGDSGIPATSETGIYETTPQTAVSEPTTPLPEVIPTNSESMAAQALAKVKKQAKQIENAHKAVTKVSTSLKKAAKERAAQEKKQDQQIKKLRSQIAQMQRQLAKVKSTGKNSAGKKKKAKPKKRQR